APVNSLLIDQHNSNLLYVGTEVGIFGSIDGGLSWSPSNDGPANVPVDQLFWVGDRLIAATHGRGCFAIQTVTWVAFGSGPGDGTYAHPYSTLTGGANAVFPQGLIMIKGP